MMDTRQLSLRRCLCVDIPKQDYDILLQQLQSMGCPVETVKGKRAEKK